ncbi:hypothetical protein Val02_64450 [Virgisporangium aliadipatigenens]|uniref:Uncharacterized protein n=1 Tax=Virgisporangium aliadipatigenens TaxID=741659 RepID=A0A8J3YQ05_9ACTN|nr:hypothetical protein [Virgisporangium aliadipatigenens]GIJ49559.1 hypothetical protein Val02_64450 [Virgisporangium aliadipatigenens]
MDSRVRRRVLSVALLALLLVPFWPAGAVHAAPDTGKYYIVGEPVGAQREYLFGIAVRTLKNGNRYREIFDLNADRVQPDGGILTDAMDLRPGWILALPPDASGPGVKVGPIPPYTPSSVPSQAASRPPAQSPAPDAKASADDIASETMIIRVGATVLTVVLFALALLVLRRPRRPAAATAGGRSRGSGPTSPRKPSGGSGGFGRPGGAGGAGGPGAPRRPARTAAVPEEYDGVERDALSLMPRGGADAPDAGSDSSGPGSGGQRPGARAPQGFGRGRDGFGRDESVRGGFAEGGESADGSASGDGSSSDGSFAGGSSADGADREGASSGGVGFRGGASRGGSRSGGAASGDGAGSGGGAGSDVAASGGEPGSGGPSSGGGSASGSGSGGFGSGGFTSGGSLRGSAAELGGWSTGGLSGPIGRGPGRAIPHSAEDDPRQAGAPGRSSGVGRSGESGGSVDPARHDDPSGADGHADDRRGERGRGGSSPRGGRRDADGRDDAWSDDPDDRYGGPGPDDEFRGTRAHGSDGDDSAAHADSRGGFAGVGPRGAGRPDDDTTVGDGDSDGAFGGSDPHGAGRRDGDVSAGVGGSRGGGPPGAGWRDRDESVGGGDSRGAFAGGGPHGAGGRDDAAGDGEPWGEWPADGSADDADPDAGGARSNGHGVEPSGPAGRPPATAQRAAVLGDGDGWEEDRSVPDDGTRPVADFRGAAPDLRAELSTVDGPIRVRLTGIGGDATDPPYAWVADGEQPPAAQFPVVLGARGPWSLRVDLSRAPDVVTMAGDPETCKRHLIAIVRRLMTDGVPVTVVGDVLGPVPPAGCVRVAEFGPPPGGDRGVVIAESPNEAELAVARDLLAATGNVPLLIGAVMPARWNLAVPSVAGPAAGTHSNAHEPAAARIPEQAPAVSAVTPLPEPAPVGLSQDPAAALAHGTPEVDTSGSSHVDASGSSSADSSGLSPGDAPDPSSAPAPSAADVSDQPAVVETTEADAGAPGPVSVDGSDGSASREVDRADVGLSGGVPADAPDGPAFIEDDPLVSGERPTHGADRVVAEAPDAAVAQTEVGSAAHVVDGMPEAPADAGDQLSEHGVDRADSAADHVAPAGAEPSGVVAAWSTESSAWAQEHAAPGFDTGVPAEHAEAVSAQPWVADAGAVQSWAGGAGSGQPIVGGSAEAGAAWQRVVGQEHADAGRTWAAGHADAVPVQPWSGDQAEAGVAPSWAGHEDAGVAQPVAGHHGAASAAAWVASEADAGVAPPGGPGDAGQLWPAGQGEGASAQHWPAGRVEGDSGASWSVGHADGVSGRPGVGGPVGAPAQVSGSGSMWSGPPRTHVPPSPTHDSWAQNAAPVPEGQAQWQEPDPDPYAVPSTYGSDPYAVPPPYDASAQPWPPGQAPVVPAQHRGPVPSAPEHDANAHPWVQGQTPTAPAQDHVPVADLHQWAQGHAFPAPAPQWAEGQVPASSAAEAPSHHWMHGQAPYGHGPQWTAEPGVGAAAQGQVPEVPVDQWASDQVPYGHAPQWTPGQGSAPEVPAQQWEQSWVPADAGHHGTPDPTAGGPSGYYGVHGSAAGVPQAASGGVPVPQQAGPYGSAPRVVPVPVGEAPVPRPVPGQGGPVRQPVPVPGQGGPVRQPVPVESGPQPGAPVPIAYEPVATPVPVGGDGGVQHVPAARVSSVGSYTAGPATPADGTSAAAARRAGSRGFGDTVQQSDGAGDIGEDRDG